MDLPVMPPVRPMLAKAQPTVPDQTTRDPHDEASGPAWLYEPKWDGFRCIVFRDGDEVVLGSRNEKPLNRYFPEVVDAVRAELPSRVVLDAELVVPREVDGRIRLDWDSLSQRIHPAASRVAMLAGETPAQVIAFDCLAIGDTSLLARPLTDRRAALESLFADGRAGGAGRSVHLSISTTDAGTARGWFSTFEGAGLDGVVAKRLAGPYRPDQRDMVKIKHHRTADCVVVGYRRHKSIDGVGSLLLGLYEGDTMHMVGGASAFTTPVQGTPRSVIPTQAGCHVAIDYWKLTKGFNQGDVVQKIDVIDGDISPYVGTVTAVHKGLGVLDVQWPFGNERVFPG